MYATSLLIGALAVAEHAATVGPPSDGTAAFRSSASVEGSPIGGGRIFAPPLLQAALSKGLAESPTARHLWQRALAMPAYIRMVPAAGLEPRLYSVIHFTAGGTMVQTIYYPYRFQVRTADGRILNPAVAALFHELAHGVEILEGRRDAATGAPAILRGWLAHGHARSSGGGRHETQFAVRCESEIGRELRSAEAAILAAGARGEGGDGEEWEAGATTVSSAVR